MNAVLRPTIINKVNPAQSQAAELWKWILPRGKVDQDLLDTLGQHLYRTCERTQLNCASLSNPQKLKQACVASGCQVIGQILFSIFKGSVVVHAFARIYLYLSNQYSCHFYSHLWRVQSTDKCALPRTGTPAAVEQVVMPWLSCAYYKSVLSYAFPSVLFDDVTIWDDSQV